MSGICGAKAIFAWYVDRDAALALDTNPDTEHLALTDNPRKKRPSGQLQEVMVSYTHKTGYRDALAKKVSP